MAAISYNKLAREAWQRLPGRRLKVMKNLLKGAAVMAAVMIANLIISIVCNMNGIELNSTVTGTVSAVSAILIYHGLTKNEKN